MWTRQYRKSRMRYVWFPVLATVLCGYFYYHAVHGRFGLEASETYDRTIAALTTEVEDLKDGRTRLEERTIALRDGTLERDMIDEQARRVLGVSRSNELILLHSSN